MHWSAPSGHARGPVVVYLTGFTQPPPDEAPVIAQRNKTFLPTLRVIVAGQSVQFTNEDKFVHNVFSTSKARTFDLGKPGPGDTRSVRFPTPGLVSVYCNIHETMFAAILVVPNRAFTWVGDDGRFVLRDIPPGHHTLHAWGFDVEPFSVDVSIEGAERHAVELTLTERQFNPAHFNKFGQPYREPRKGYGP